MSSNFKKDVKTNFYSQVYKNYQKMSVSSRGQKIYEIDPSNFSSIHLKGYIRAYFEDDSLNISSGVPILVLDGDLDWIDISIDIDHPFYSLFRELSKNNENLYNAYFREKNKITLRVNGENLQETKKFCKLDIRVRIIQIEEVVFKSESDPQYKSEWKFLLNINKVEFM